MKSFKKMVSKRIEIANIDALTCTPKLRHAIILKSIALLPDLVSFMLCWKYSQALESIYRFFV